VEVEQITVLVVQEHLGKAVMVAQEVCFLEVTHPALVVAAHLLLVVTQPQ
jgi:hypothetical protein